MANQSDSGIGIFGVLAIALILIYLAVLLASIVAGAAAVGGTIWGGGTALKNYGLSFKENIIDSNRRK